MNKSRSFTGQPIFAQVLKLIPRPLISNLVKKHKTERYVKSFSTYDHLVSMLFCVFQRCNSLREVSTGMLSWQGRLVHLGVKHAPRRSTLSDTNKRCPEAFFKDVYHSLIRIYYSQLLPDSRTKKKRDERVYFVDSTTIELFNEVMKGAGSYGFDGKKKGGVKAHMAVNALHHVPNIVYLSEAKENDRIFMDKIEVPSGSILVFDKGYFKFSQWQKWTDEKVFWVTRLSNVAYYEVLEDKQVNPKQLALGVEQDQEILLGRGTSPGTEVILARRIRFYDSEMRRHFDFVTNHMSMSPGNIAALYKSRWQIESLFKSVKQNYQLRYFLGDNANAVCIQVWCSLIADLLIKVVKNQVKKRAWAHSNLISMIRMHLGTYVNLFQFLENPERTLLKTVLASQYQLAFDHDTS